jgi:hypothetical protein
VKEARKRREQRAKEEHTSDQVNDTHGHEHQVKGETEQHEKQVIQAHTSESMRTKMSISTLLSAPRIHSKPATIKDTRTTPITKVSRNKHHHHQSRHPVRLAWHYSTHHTRRVAIWQRRFANGIQTAMNSPHTLHRARQYREREIEAAGALLALRRPVGPALEEQAARPALWGKKTIALSIDMVKCVGRKEGGT